MEKDKLLGEQILNGNFYEASKLVNGYDFDKFADFITELAFNKHNIIIYDFICYLINKKEDDRLHSLAYDLMCHPFCYIENAYKTGLHHARKAIVLNPDEVGYKEMLLFLYNVPERLISKQEATEIVQQILSQDPENECVKGFLKHHFQ
ncbi:hypothetical protein [Bacillus mycoides]|uniref:hypothetical protein n=1 Tax=Bacillus mycoides TaxID=1405 RepID=UPI001C013AE8|nr:hypothetical protein [Bacillus mycoides]QWH75606.1 hypothetical protein EXW59_01750 [Bacillus mycoides]